jgi:hypothetical protein
MWSTRQVIDDNIEYRDESDGRSALKGLEECKKPKVSRLIRMSFVLINKKIKSIFMFEQK